MMPNILIIGAASAIAEHTARHWAAQGAAFYLVGRGEAHLQRIAADLRVRGARSVEVAALDVCELDRHGALVDAAAATLGSIDIALVAHGLLAPRVADLTGGVKEMMDTNATSTVSLIEHLARRIESQRSGTIAVISSVAGDRGRASNPLYGAAKAAVTAHASAVRQRLARVGGWVVTVKPGFVDTPMTAGFAKGPLWASPEAVAAGIVRAVGRRQATAYLPGFWRWVMLAVRALPERLFVKMKF
jgi:decaprenylphospho-beta-D-erythro-pentofuranosid-2-ulose 2-reductase